MFVNEDKCREFGLDPRKVTSIASRLSRAAREADAIGLIVFGGTGSGSLRFSRSLRHGPEENEVALLDGSFDGGDGGDNY